MTREEYEALVEKVGGESRLASVLQRRVKELCAGAEPLVEPPGRDFVLLAMEEIRAGKIELKPDPPSERRKVRRDRDRDRGKEKGRRRDKPARRKRRRGGRRRR